MKGKYSNSFFPENNDNIQLKSTTVYADITIDSAEANNTAIIALDDVIPEGQYLVGFQAGFSPKDIFGARDPIGNFHSYIRFDSSSFDANEPRGFKLLESDNLVLLSDPALFGGDRALYWFLYGEQAIPVGQFLTFGIFVDIFYANNGQKALRYLQSHYNV